MSANPGSLAAQAPQYPATFQSRKTRDAERAATEQAASKTGQAMQIGAGGITVDNGGSIRIVGTGQLVTNGAINTTGSISASTTVSAGTTITAGGNITSTAGSLSGVNVIASSNVSASGSVSAGTTVSGAAVTSSGNISASGQVISAGIVNSPGTKANTVTVGYSAVYIDSAGNMGGNTSSLRYKQDVSLIRANTTSFLGLKTYRFRYIEAVNQLGDKAPWEYGLMAEDVVKVAPWACFYEEDGTTVRGINYDRLVVALLNVVQDHEQRLDAAGL